MSELQTFRLVVEIVGVIATGVGGVIWMTRLMWRIKEMIENLQADVTETRLQATKTNGQVAANIAQLTEHAEALAFLKGKQEAKDELAATIVAAVQLAMTPQIRGHDE